MRFGDVVVFAVRFGDVVVFRRHPDPDASRHDPSEIELVAEVVSADSMHDDRVVKPDLHGAAGIGEAVLSELEEKYRTAGR